MSFEGAAGCPHAGAEKSRAQWMAAEGREIFEPWTLAVAGLYGQMIDSGALNGQQYEFGPTRFTASAVDKLTHTNQFDRLTTDYLLPHIDTLRHYTSLESFAKNKMPNGDAVPAPIEEALTMHARDSIRFAAMAPVLVAQLQWFHDLVNDRRPGLSYPRNQKQDSDVYPRILGDAYEYVEGLLADLGYGAAVHELAATSFDTLSVKFSHDLDLFNTTGTYQTAVRQLRRSGNFFKAEELPPLLDFSGPQVSLQPALRTLLRHALFMQNHGHLDYEARRTAGNLIKLALPLSSGCPVKNGPAIDALSSQTVRYMQETMQIARHDHAGIAV